MAPIILYRIEDNKGFGPFSSTKSKGCVRDAYAMPTPTNDIPEFFEMDTSKFFYAFLTLTKLCYWFSISDREALMEHFNIKLMMVSCGAVRFGKNQVAFVRNAAICVGSLSITTLTDESLDSPEHTV